MSWRDVALCLSLANLCYFNVWDAVQSLEPPDVQYAQKFPFVEILLVTTTGVLLLSLLLCLSLGVVRRSRNPRLTTSAQCAFLLFLIIPIKFIETHAVPSGARSGPVAGAVIALGFVALDIVILIAPVLILTRRSRMPVTIARTAVLIFAPLLPVLLIQAAWCALRSPSAAAFQDKPLATPFPHRSAAARRLVWLVFDEMDERFVSRRRSRSIALSEFDRFRSEAFEAVNARSPARWTLVSMPALICGRLLSEAEPEGVDDLTLTLKDGGRQLQWSAQPNVFSRARDAGLNTGLVGWYHPYCRVLSASLTECWWQPYLSAAQSTRREADERTLDVVGTLLAQSRRHLGALVLATYFGGALTDETGRQENEWDRQQRHLDYLQIRRHALEMVANPDLGLVLAHWPVPHPVGFYNRSTHTLASDFYGSYIQNLALSDRTLGEVRMAMERAGVWDRTSVLISSDHGLRNEADPDGTREAQVTGGGGPLPSVPFLLKLAGQDHALQYGPAFNTVLTHDLILSLLRGELTSPESVRRWLDANRARFPIN